MSIRQASLFPAEDRESSSRPLRGKTEETEGHVSSIWSFEGPSGDYLYRWYGTLPRALVERLLLMYARKSDSKILDPFMGSGVTLEVAHALGLRSIGIDNNPLACLIAETRLADAPRRPDLVREVERISGRLSRLAKDNNKSSVGTDLEAVFSSERYAYTRKWFRTDSVRTVLSLLAEVIEVEDESIQRLLFVAGVQVLRDVASVDSRCIHHLVTKRKGYVDPIPLWQERVFDSLAAMKNEQVDPELTSVRQASVMDTELEDYGTNFALLHPPYPGVIQYHLIHRLATDLLDLVNSVTAPITLKKYDFRYDTIKRTDVSTDDFHKYRGFVSALASRMERTVAPGGRCAVIMGDQRYKGHVRHPFTDFIASFERHGFALEEIFVWVLQNNSGMHILRRGHFIDHNYILMFDKDGRER